MVDVQVKVNPNLFSAFALLNITGYDAENGWLFCPTRQRLRCALAKHSNFWRDVIKEAELLKPIILTGGAILMDNIPQLPDPSDSSPQLQKTSYLTTWQSSSLQYLPRIKDILKQFSSGGSFNVLWKTYARDCERQIAVVESKAPCLKKVFEQFPETSLPNRLEVFVNLLDAKGRGYSLSSRERSWLFLNPMTNRLRNLEELIVHEMLHRWVDPIAEQQLKDCEASVWMPHARAMFRLVSESYKEYFIWVGETVVRAVTAWFMREGANSEKVLQHAEQIGFVGAGKAFDCLVNNRSQPLSEILPKLIDIVTDDIAFNFTKQCE